MIKLNSAIKLNSERWKVKYDLEYFTEGINKCFEHHGGERMGQMGRQEALVWDSKRLARDA